MTIFVPTADLRLLEDNPRIGDIRELTASLIMSTQYKNVVVNKGTHTGRPMEVVAGNHTVEAIRQLADADPDDPRWAHIPKRLIKIPPGDPSWQMVECKIFDFDEEELSRLAVADNRIPEKGSFDDVLLLQRLHALPDLAGTGYTDIDLAALEDIVAGAPDLDDLADELGDEPEEDQATLSLKKIDPHTKRMWLEHRADFADDDTALARLLDDPLRETTA